MVDDMKILTIITPTFNLVKAGRIEAFRQCVESVHEQSCLEKIEHIVVDGESTDGTTAILDEYRGRGYFNVVSKKDHSVYEGMNNGLAVATGKYVLFLNSDDFFHGKTGLGRALDEVEKAGVDYAFGDVHVVTLDGSYRRTWVGSTDGLPFATHYCHQSMLVKASVLRGYGGFQLT